MGMNFFEYKKFPNTCFSEKKERCCRLVTHDSSYNRKGSERELQSRMHRTDFPENQYWKAQILIKTEKKNKNTRIPNVAYFSLESISSLILHTHYLCNIARRTCCILTSISNEGSYCITEHIAILHCTIWSDKALYTKAGLHPLFSCLVNRFSSSISSRHLY